MQSTPLPTKRAWLRSPTAALGAGLVLSMGLAVLPKSWTDGLRSAVATGLRPGQTAAVAARAYAARAVEYARSHFGTAASLTDCRLQIERLEQENRRLAAELTAAQRVPAVRDGQSPAEDRLVTAHAVAASVLGRQARAFLAREHILDAGSHVGLQPEALVLDAPPVIDRGEDAQLKAGQLVLLGRRVWGKINHLGPYTSTVQTVTSAGFRDLVEVGESSGVQGIVEGTGERLARVRLVDVTAPVAVGDPVCSATTKGVLPARLLYGYVTRVERPVGAAHWEIWMQPAVVHQPEQVLVVRTELNPLRMAGEATIGSRR